MTAYKKLDFSTWNRREQFHFFKDYENPFFNICADVDVTELYNFAKKNNYSFFLSSLFASIKTANLIEPFRYRIRNDDVIIYDKIDLGSTVLNEDDTFNFCYFDYTPNFKEFYQAANSVLEQNKKQRFKMNVHREIDNLIYYSVIPWISFTSFSHARNYSTRESIPKIVIGKITKTADKFTMPVSVEVHHALMDGLHVGKYFKLLQEILDEPSLF